LGVLLDAVDYEEAVTRILEAARMRKPMAVSAVAVHGVITGVLDATQRYRLNHLDLVVPDGQPVRWALDWLYRTELPDRVYGPALTLKICEKAAGEGLPIYLYGSRPEVLLHLSSNLRSRFPSLIIAGSQPSRFRQLTRQEKEEVAQEIRNSKAAVTFVGLGCPRQEVWVYEYREILSMPLIAVGAAFDFYAGTVPQAPLRMQQLGMEWFYRLMREPRRLWKRYVLLNPLYVLLVALQAMGLNRFDPSNAVAPLSEMRYG
jgi:exopolysaccharide biosynthesis WecB/TagA/CpsF family protein